MEFCSAFGPLLPVYWAIKLSHNHTGKTVYLLEDVEYVEMDGPEDDIVDGRARNGIGWWLMWRLLRA